MNFPLMPKATAVWLVENTTLTFEQIANFCGIHLLEIQGIADGEVAVGIVAENPILNGQLTKEEIIRCENDESAHLKISPTNEYILKNKKKKGAKYIPVARRQDKPDAVAWLIKNYPDLSNEKISKLVGTTKTTVIDIREKTHWNYENLRPRDPVILGICSQTALNELIKKLESDSK